MKTQWALPDTPFFDAAHAEVVGALNRWIDHNRPVLEGEHHGSLTEQCAYWLHSLAVDGILQYAVPGH